MADLIDRKTFLGRAARTSAGLALLGSVPATFGAAAADAAMRRSEAFGEAVIQLGWLKNVEWAGEYLADHNGFYKAAGFSSVSLLPGGPTAPPIESVVSSGKALTGISSPASTAAAILHGAKLKIIGVQYQRSPYCIVSLAGKPIRSPKEMLGKRIGVPQSNQPTWFAFLAANGIDAKQVKTVTVGFNPSVLPNQQVDGLLAFVTNEPITLKAQGVVTHNFLLSDFKFPLVNNNYIVTTDALANNRDQVKAMLKAEIQGWKASLANPAQAAKLTVQSYGSDLGLNLAEQVQQSKVQNTLVTSAGTKRNGLFTVTPTLIAQNIQLLRLSKVRISAKQLFDLSALNELYSGEPSLR
jgi:ABC-type nitrate/sulfonate/bicarbonate transport system substrate-binding protein